MGCIQSLLRTDADIEALYSMDRVIGDGVEGCVYLATCNTTGAKVAIKLIRRGDNLGLGEEFTRREVQLQARLSHVNIVELKKVVLTRRHLGIVMSYVAGGDLHAYCLRFKLKEVVALYFFRQMVDGLEYCHQNKVAHRDLKLANFVLTSERPPRLKLTDFGCSRGWGDKSLMCKMRERRFKTFAGTPAYMSPQVLRSAFYPTNTYDAVQADVWALGVALCHMFFGTRIPYWLTPNAFRDAGMTMQARIAAMGSQRWDASNDDLKEQAQSLSPELRDLLDKIFVADEEARISISGIKAHPWYNQQLPPMLHAALEDMSAEQELRSRLSRATLDSSVHNGMPGRQVKVEAAEPSTQNFAQIDALVKLATTRGKMPGGAAERVFCLDMAHLDVSVCPRKTQPTGLTGCPLQFDFTAQVTDPARGTKAAAAGGAAVVADGPGVSGPAMSDGAAIGVVVLDLHR